MYIFKIEKSPDSSHDQSESAVYCAKDCVISVLDDESLSVKVDENNIVINHINHDQEINITFDECSEKVKGCFCDASGKLYSEFTRVEPLEGKAPNK